MVLSWQIYTENVQQIILVSPKRCSCLSSQAEKLIEVLLFLLSLGHQFLLHILQ